MLLGRRVECRVVGRPRGASVRHSPNSPKTREWKRISILERGHRQPYRHPYRHRRCVVVCGKRGTVSPQKNRARLESGSWRATTLRIGGDNRLVLSPTMVVVSFLEQEKGTTTGHRRLLLRTMMVGVLFVGARK